jgi:hypothetical protein
MTNRKLGDKFEVILVFDDEGQLADVQPGKGTEGYERKRIKNLTRKKFFAKPLYFMDMEVPAIQSIKPRMDISKL